PQTREERIGWVIHSAAAGITEELTWRGVQPALIAQLTGHLWPAIVICAATFGLGHIRFGKAFVPIAAFFALIFQALAWATGGLYVPMLVHVAVNVIVGLRAGTWVKLGRPGL
ncbi:MAG TPA: CPBP family intramembrane glutamic endopeptidase, partial [Vicinamibacterales bacterium]|nr:CPBP family intramembrane glutamic endopeptidase [Vicinamibacterales bacterium]